MREVNLGSIEVSHKIVVTSRVVVRVMNAVVCHVVLGRNRLVTAKQAHFPSLVFGSVILQIGVFGRNCLGRRLYPIVGSHGVLNVLFCAAFSLMARESQRGKQLLWRARGGAMERRTRLEGRVYAVFRVQVLSAVVELGNARVK